MCCCLAIPGHGTKSWAPSQRECLRSREGCPVPSHPRRPSEAEERRVEGKTGSWAAPQTEPGRQVPLVRSNAQSPVVKPALAASGSSAASCPECCSGSSSGALLASPLSSAGPCKEKVKTQPPATGSINMWQETHWGKGPIHHYSPPLQPSSSAPFNTRGDWMLNPKPELPWDWMLTLSL